MTCIVGLVHGGKVLIGADSAGVCGWDLVVRKDRKVFKKNDFLIGFTTSFRMGQLLEYSFKPPHRDPEKAVMEFMVVDFVNALRDCFKTGGYAKKDSEVESAGQFLVGYEGRLFNIGGDYQVSESVAGYDACGCGAAIAIGAMYANAKRQPIDRVKQALAAAESNSAGVRGPFHVVTTL